MDSAVRLHVESRGPVAGEPILLIQGLGQQLIDWPEALVAALAARCRVILCDNRDAGLSPLAGPALDPALKPSDFPTADAPPGTAPYTLHDMAADIRAVLDRLAIEQAHILGYSMGGMIAQIFAARYPARTRSLVSLMSSDGAPWIAATPLALAAMARSITGGGDLAARIDMLAEDAALYRGPHLAFDRAEARSHIAAALDRADRPAGIYRQAQAMRGSGDRRALLERIGCPTLVVHGSDDPVIAPEQGRAAAARIPRARLEMLDRAGHDFAPEVTATLCRVIPDFLARG
ncbi:alpha/beta fold hydrolase [Dongia sedimenti]|uniref:Alpha/beta fold hydrolase n=1 Tax=Dongia sedimenti TaxID=3064282 RepID=A0ABU0YJ80_9PROT|nr:alpha/beta fold hydrolase [Rhodospirillaceae bacterium R-7]